MKTRCAWAEGKEDFYVRYHDEEWGVPVHDDRKHFEFLVLEAAQAGLSWATVLKRRAGYRKAFSDWDVKRVARYTPEKIEKLLQDPGIIRNRLKVEAAVSNAREFLKVQEEFDTFDQYFWQFVDGQPVLNHWTSMQDVPSKTELSDAVSKDLKKRGFRFVGSTVIYAHLQATGLVNDHTVDCFRHKEVQGLQQMRS